MPGGVGEVGTAGEDGEGSGSASGAGGTVASTGAVRAGTRSARSAGGGGRSTMVRGAPARPGSTARSRARATRSGWSTSTVGPCPSSPTSPTAPTSTVVAEGSVGPAVTMTAPEGSPWCRSSAISSGSHQTTSRRAPAAGTHSRNDRANGEPRSTLSAFERGARRRRSRRLFSRRASDTRPTAASARGRSSSLTEPASITRPLPRTGPTAGPPCHQTTVGAASVASASQPTRVTRASVRRPGSPSGRTTTTDPGGVGDDGGSGAGIATERRRGRVGYPTGERSGHRRERG